MIEEAKRDLHYDIIYAWSKLILHHAFEHSVVSERMGLEVAKTLERKEAEDNVAKASAGFLKSKEFKSMLKRLSKAHDNYIGIKKILPKDSGYSLSSVDEKLMETIAGLTQDETRVIKDDGDTAAVAQTSDIGDKRKRLKEMYFGTDQKEERKRYKEPDSPGDDSLAPGTSISNQEDSSECAETVKPASKGKKKKIKKS